MKTRAALLAVLILSCQGLRAQAPDPPAARALSLVVGKGELLRFDQDIARVVIAEPKIADAIIVSPRDVMVNAKGWATPLC